MSKNPFRQVKEEIYNGGSRAGESNGISKNSEGLGENVRNGVVENRGYENGGKGHEQSNDTSYTLDNSGPRTFNEQLAVQYPNGTNTDPLPDGLHGLQINEHQKNPEQQPRHAHLPSISRIRKESFPSSRPPYTRAPSSHVAESIVSRIPTSEARAEAIRRLSKASRTSKTLKRRGSNESLSSLLSYSIRRPSLTPSPKTNGHSLSALSHVLEDAAQEGNLALVEAIMDMGADPNFRSVNRIKNRRHAALEKATAAGHVEVVEFLMDRGATWDGNVGEGKKDGLEAIDVKVLEAMYSGHMQVARYFIEKCGANPFAQQWPREYFDARRTVYRRVVSARVYQRTFLDALTKMGNEMDDTDAELLGLIMSRSDFDPTTPASSIYTDTPYAGDGTRMCQTTYHFSALSTFISAGWSNAVSRILAINHDPAAYQILDKVTNEEGQIPSSVAERCIWPSNALGKDTWTYHPDAAMRILKLLIEYGFDVSTSQHTPHDSAPRTPLSRAVLSNSAPAVKTLLSAYPDLVKQEISFRVLLPTSEFEEYTVLPLTAALVQGSFDCARVLLDYGASPHDSAAPFRYQNVMMLGAGHGISSILPDFIELAPKLLPQALEMAIQKFRVDAVRILLESASVEQLGELRVWDVVLSCEIEGKEEDVQARYVRIMEMVREKGVKGRPGNEAVRKAVEMGNVVGVERLMNWGTVERYEVGVTCQDLKAGREWSEMLNKPAKT